MQIARFPPPAGRLDHQPPGNSEHVTENVAELDIGIFEDLLNTIALACPFPHQLSASASQIPEFPDSAFGNKTRSDHAVAKQVRQPAAVVGRIRRCFMSFNSCYEVGRSLAIRPRCGESPRVLMMTTDLTVFGHVTPRCQFFP